MKTSKIEGYKIPENYFTNSKEDFINKIRTLEDKDVNIEPKVKSIRRWFLPITGIAASLLLTVGLFLNRNTTKPGIENQDEAFLFSYIEYNIDAYSLDDIYELNTTMLDDQIDLEDSELLELMSDLELEEFYDLM